MGSQVASELGRSGLGSFVLIDGERLDPENVVRHELGDDDVGENKAEGMARLLVRRMPGTHVEYVPYKIGERFSNATLDRTLQGCDLIVATTDSREAQRRINRRALDLDIPAIFPGVDEEAHRGEVFVSLGPGRTPCFECWDLHRDVNRSLRGVVALNIDLLQTVECSVRVALGLLDPTSEYAELFDRPVSEWTRRGGRPPTLFMVNRPGGNGQGAFAGGRTFRALYPDFRNGCPACGGVSETPRTPRPPRSTPASLPRQRRTSRGAPRPTAVWPLMLLLIVGAAFYQTRGEEVKSPDTSAGSSSEPRHAANGGRKSPTPQHLVTPESVGRLEVGMVKREVDSMLGPPARQHMTDTVPEYGKATYKGPDGTLTLHFCILGSSFSYPHTAQRLSAIRTSNPRYRDEHGNGPGKPVAALKASYSADLLERGIAAAERFNYDSELHPLLRFQFAPGAASEEAETGCLRNQCGTVPSSS